MRRRLHVSGRRIACLLPRHTDVEMATLVESLEIGGGTQQPVLSGPALVLNWHRGLCACWRTGSRVARRTTLCTPRSESFIKAALIVRFEALASGAGSATKNCRSSRRRHPASAHAIYRARPSGSFPVHRQCPGLPGAWFGFRLRWWGRSSRWFHLRSDRVRRLSAWTDSGSWLFLILWHG